jgi:serine/threonine protein kinase
MQLLKGLKFMHESGIIHGDITPDSLFFKSEEGSQIRFVDLGCGCFPTSGQKPSGNGNGFCRTPKSAHAASSLGSFWSATGSQRGTYGREDTFGELNIERAAALCRAPEAFATPPIVSDKMDVWSVGCILYQMETGEPLGHVSSFLLLYVCLVFRMSST